MEMRRTVRNRVTEIIPIQRGLARHGSSTILRETLLRSLVERCRELGVKKSAPARRLSGAQPEGVLLLADGSERTADLVIGADGIQLAGARLAGPAAISKEARLWRNSADDRVARPRTICPQPAATSILGIFTGSRRILLHALQRDRSLYSAVLRRR